MSSQQQFNKIIKLTSLTLALVLVYQNDAHCAQVQQSAATAKPAQATARGFGSNEAYQESSESAGQVSRGQDQGFRFDQFGQGMSDQWNNFVKQFRLQQGGQGSQNVGTRQGGGGGLNNFFGFAGSSEQVSERSEEGEGRSIRQGELEREVVEEKSEKKEDLFKLLLNPIELVKAISKKYKLHFQKFLELVGKKVTFGIEAALSPFTITIKIIEKVFQPDTCRLHFVCKMGSNVGFAREHVPKFSPGFSEGSSSIKAFGEGLLGSDCGKKFVCESGEPKLRKEYEGLRRDRA